MPGMPGLYGNGVSAGATGRARRGGGLLIHAQFLRENPIFRYTIK